jgi:hypothetical protein
MFDSSGSPEAPWSTHDLAAVATRLRDLPVAVDESDAIDRIRLLEELKAVCAAVQARETASLCASRRDAEAARGVPAARRCRGLASEVALARRDSPARGSRHVGLANGLVHEMPHTMAALTAGAISEWRAVLVAKETAWLPVEGRRHVDALVAPYLTSTGDRVLAAPTRAFAQAWDPEEAVRHLRRAQEERRVSLRPAPDTMVYLTALLPMVQGVAAYAALDKAAASAVSSGEAGSRGRGQVMADLLVERLTGQETAAAVPVEIHLVMTDAALFGDPAEGTPREAADGAPRIDATARIDPTALPAWLVGSGPLPAAAARDLIDPARDGPGDRARVWLRRLYTDPTTGHLVAMDSRRRLFDGHLRRMVVLRDDTCRTPWCDAPIRHADHGSPHRAGGGTTFANGSGLCERCNHTKEAERWRHEASADALDVTTPTGHTYRAPTRPILDVPVLTGSRRRTAPAAAPRRAAG